MDNCKLIIEIYYILLIFFYEKKVYCFNFYINGKFLLNSLLVIKFYLLLYKINVIFNLFLG